MEQQSNEYRSHREQFSTQIRRQNRNQILSKRRDIENTNKSQNQIENNKFGKQHIIDNRFQKQIKEYQDRKLEPLLQYLTAINDPDILKQHYGVIGVRKLLSLTNNPFVQNIIDAGLIPKLISYVKQTNYPQLQLQASWCLANVAAGNSTQTNSIIEKGGIKMFVDLLLSQHVGIVQHAILVIGNIACNAVAHRDLLIKAGGHKNLVKIVQRTVDRLPQYPQLQVILQSAIWSMTSICRTKPVPGFMTIKQILQEFFYVIKNKIIKNDEILSHICWSLSYYTENTKDDSTKKVDKIQNCIDQGVVPEIMQFLNNKYDQIGFSSAKIIGNLSLGNHQQLAYLMQLGILDKMQELLHSQKKVYRKQACYILSNFVGCSEVEVEQVFSRQSLSNKLIQLLREDLPDIQSQICCLFSNAIQIGDPNKMYCFINQIGLLNHLSSLTTKIKDVKLILNLLGCLRSILELGKIIHQSKNNNFFVKQWHRLGAIGWLEELQYHDSDKIYQEAIKIIALYFQHEDPLKIQNLAKNMI